MLMIVGLSCKPRLDIGDTATGRIGTHFDAEATCEPDAATARATTENKLIIVTMTKGLGPRNVCFPPKADLSCLKRYRLAQLFAKRVALS
jgi:hypothetical protein